jgi:glucose/arabinose dehydrogenase
MNRFMRPKTRAMADFIKKEGPEGRGRVVGVISDPDGVFIYTDSNEWCDDAGAGTFRGDTETTAIKHFKSRVRKAEQ